MEMLGVIPAVVKTARGRGCLLHLPHSLEGSFEKDVGQKGQSLAETEHCAMSPNRSPNTAGVRDAKIVPVGRARTALAGMCPTCRYLMKA